MTFQNTIQPIIDELNHLNGILKTNHIKTNIDMNNIIDNLIEKEKEYQILKFNIELSENNFEQNINLLKSKLDLEYKIYKLLCEHKERINELSSKYNGLPSIDTNIESLFNINNINNIKLDKEVENNNLSKPVLPEKKSSLTTQKSNKSLASNSNNKDNDSNGSNSTKRIKIPTDTLQSQLSAAVALRKTRCEK